MGNKTEHYIGRVPCYDIVIIIHRVKWHRSNLWSHYDLCVVGQHGVLCEVKWWRFVAFIRAKL